LPTGVALRDPRDQLFEAAERVMLRAGPSALTSRAVTEEAGVAKGVLHRHFADFDAFLAELVLDRIARMDSRAAALLESAGTGIVVGNLTGALIEVLTPVALGIVSLITSRDAVRTRLREVIPAGVPVLTEAVQIIAAYLRAEQELGRLAVSADADRLAPTLIGAAHLLFAGRDGVAPDVAEVAGVVTTVIGGALAEPPRHPAAAPIPRPDSSPGGRTAPAGAR
jgi:AcrR family transcriptional regulator